MGVVHVGSVAFEDATSLLSFDPVNVAAKAFRFTEADLPSPKPVVILSFVDLRSTDWDWVAKMDDTSLFPATGVLRLVAFYDTSTTPISSDVAGYVAYLDTMRQTHLAADSPKNSTWLIPPLSGEFATSWAREYLNAYTGDASPNAYLDPLIFVINASFRVADAFHLGSANAGSGKDPDASSGWNKSDYLDFDWANFVPVVDTNAKKLVKFAAYLNARILDLQATSPKAVVGGLPAGDYLAEGSEMTVTFFREDGLGATFPKGAWGARAATTYRIGGYQRFGIAPTPTDEPYKLSLLLAGTKETRRILLGDFTPEHSQDSRPVPNLTIDFAPDALVDGNDIDFVLDPPCTAKLLRKGAALFVRSNSSDDGHAPKANSGIGSLFGSIDILSMAATRDIAAAQALASPADSNPSDAYDLRPGTTYYMHLRAKNAGALDITPAAAPPGAVVSSSLYYFPTSTLVPNSLHVIGNPSFIGAGAIPGNFGRLAVSGPVGFTAPASGHYCYVSTIGTADFPEPYLPALIDTAGSIVDWHNLVANNFNIAWRNFNVIVLTGGGGSPSPPPGAPKLPDPRPGWHQIPFDFPGGFSRKDGPLQLVMKQNFPSRVEFHADLAKGLKGAWRGFEGDRVFGQGKAAFFRTRLAPSELSRFRPVKLAPRLSNPVWLNIFLPEGLRGSWDLEASAFCEGVEVGRVTWRFIARPWRDIRGEKRLASRK